MFIADLDINLGDSSGDGCADLGLVLGVGHGYFDNVFLSLGIRDLDFAADTIKFKGDRAHAFLVNFAESEVLDDQRVAVCHIDLIGLADGQAVEEYVAAQAHDVTVLLSIFTEVFVDLGIEAVR